MKFYLIFILVILTKESFSQLRIDSFVKKEFDSVLNIQPEEIKLKSKRKTFENGIAFLLTYKTDTLNYSEYIVPVYDSTSSVIAVSGETEDTSDKQQEQPKYNFWLASEASYLNDTLGIGVFSGFFSGMSFSLKIYGEKCYGEFGEYADNNSVYKFNISDSPASVIQIPAQLTNVCLSKIPIKTGDFFYGIATLTTNPFYEIDSNFKKGYLHKKYSITFIFRCKLIDIND